MFTTSPHPHVVSEIDHQSQAEDWRRIPSFPRYEANAAGRIRRIGQDSALALCPTRRGYNNYRLARDGSYVNVHGHVLVCEAFHGPRPSPKHEVAHEDGVAGRDSADNLSWKTRAENHADKRRHGTHRQGRDISWAVLQPENIPIIRARLAAGEPMSRIGADYGVSEGAINGIRIGRNWKHVP